MPELAEIDPKKCALCHTAGRFTEQFYLELASNVRDSIPEFIEAKRDGENEGMLLPICPYCRSELLESLGVWRRAAVERRSVEKDEEGRPVDR